MKRLNKKGFTLVELLAVIDCPSCRGSGIQEKSKMMSLKIPAGTDNGKRIVIPGQGDVGENGGPAGDLVVVIHVDAHTLFERSGQDLYCAVPISMTQAALGCDIEIESLNGKKVLIKIPAGTSNGKLLRVRGEGVPSTSGLKNGDLYVKIMVQIPQHLSSKQRDLLKSFMDIENPTENPKLMPLSQLER